MYQTLEENAENAISFSEVKIEEKPDRKLEVCFDLQIKDEKYQVETNLLGKPNY